jgi:hypothetical protein
MATDDLSPIVPGLAVTSLLPAGVGRVRRQAIDDDPFARRAGPDVRVQGPTGLTDAYSIYSVDPDTHRVRVMIVDGSGRVIRSIPSDSVGEMIATMNSYRRL